MVTAKLVVSRALPMDLPKAATGGEVQQLFSVSLMENGATEIDGRNAPTDQEVLQRAKVSLAQNPELRAVVQADGSVPHRRVMHVLDILRQAGLERIAFGVQAGPTVKVE